MIKFGRLRIYLGTKKFGWTMIGFGWESTWFFGFSLNNTGV